MSQSIQHIHSSQIPHISVIMSVYNGAEYLQEALDSIFAQTFQDFECIVIDDGSTDATPDILKRCSDPRLRIFTQSNHGLVYSLNTAITKSRGEFIARHDADDRSEPGRFAAQVAYLRSHPKCAVVGSNMAVMDGRSRITHHHDVLLRDPELQQELLLRSPFAHGSVMMRRSSLDALQTAENSSTGPYRHAYWPAEDYDLWLRLSAFGSLANIDEYLYVYREHGAGISAANQAKQHACVERIQADAWQQWSRLTKRRINLKPYARTHTNPQRLQRIMSNTRTCLKKARHNPRAAVRIAHQIALDPLLYRKIAGTIKRKTIKR